ncbi:sulfotransferase family protein [Psychroflexus gondwanensis]|uniref:sulfotransferase family protein n=1 Tax=Psychroflexus gondwanensis TaxID=251 RepID=UPI0011BDD216|nr:sulfotransferase family protein [Psychroflexus gondwanensis]TXE21536.1 sulfotransferase family protein [Psychroflexus gondwanensis]
MSHFHKHTLVVGSARSGTSWLSENMAKVFRYRMLFEPEHTDNTSHGYLVADQMITIKNQDNYTEGLRYLKRVLRNRVDSDWIAQNSNRTYKRHLWPFIPKHFVIKLVRGNLLAPFISQYFEIPVVHVVRHPLEVIKSQQRVRFPWLYDLSYFLKQEELIDLISNKYDINIKDFIHKSKVEILALRWCIENVVVLEDLKAGQSNQYHVVKHEALRNDVEVYKTLCQTLGIEVLGHIDNEYKKPSTKAHPKSSVRGGSELDNLSEVELENIKVVLGQFNQSLYSL